jgi:hypothetical protein
MLYPPQDKYKKGASQSDAPIPSRLSTFAAPTGQPHNQRQQKSLFARPAPTHLDNVVLRKQGFYIFDDNIKKASC